MTPLRILHVTPYYEQAWAYGGIPRVVAALTRELGRRGHRVTVCTTDACTRDSRVVPLRGRARGAWRDTVADNVEVEVFPNRSNRLAYDLQLFLPIGFAAYLRAHARDFDIGHLHAYRNAPGVLASRYLSRAGIPYLLTPHGTAPRLERRMAAKRAFDAIVGDGVMTRAARVLAVTDAERRQLETMGVAGDRIATVPNPIDLGEFTPSIQRGAYRRGSAFPDAELIVFLGKLTPRKRLDVLARAFARLRRRRARLIIAGNDMGYGRDLDRLVAELQIGDRTERPGLLRGRERLELLADADVVVYPSEDEIFGLVPLEALLCTTPVVVAGDSGCGEVIRRTGGGLVVARGEVEALAEALTTVLDDHETWRSSAQTASVRVREWFGASAVCDRLESVYRDVLGHQHGQA